MSTNPDILIHDYKTSQKEAYLVMIITRYRWRGMSTSPDKAQTHAKILTHINLIQNNNYLLSLPG